MGFDQCELGVDGVDVARARRQCRLLVEVLKISKCFTKLDSQRYSIMNGGIPTQTDRGPRIGRDLARLRSPRKNLHVRVNFFDVQEILMPTGSLFLFDCGIPEWAHLTWGPAPT